MNTTKVTLCLIAIIISSFWVVGNAKTPMLCNVHHSSRIALKGDLQTSSTRSSDIQQVIDVLWGNECLEVFSHSDLGEILISIINLEGSLFYQNKVLLIKNKVYKFDFINLPLDKYILKFTNSKGEFLLGELIN